jgi:hypothetical protein
MHATMGSASGGTPGSAGEDVLLAHAERVGSGDNGHGMTYDKAMDAFSLHGADRMIA